MKTAALAIVFTDIKGFTERTSRSTHEQSEQLLAVHSSLLAPVFRNFGGKIIKEIGDAFLVTFESPTMAVLSGVAIQDRLWEHNRTAPEALRLDVRVAINVGEVRLESGDVFGEPVNIAARVEGIAEAGEVWLTESVYLSMNKAEVPAIEVGQFELKGLPDKVRVYKVPRAPWRLEAAPEAVAGEAQPPYGNLGLSKMPDDAGARMLASTAELTQKAMGATSKAVNQAVTSVRSGGALATLKRAQKLWPVAVGLALVWLGLMLFGGSAAERAIARVEKASQTEKPQRVEEAKKLIALEKNAGQRAYLGGLLGEARGDANAATAGYTQASKAGVRQADGRLLEMLDHEKCPYRVAALYAVQGLKLKKARGRVADLAEDGGKDDGETLLFIGCNSKQVAEGVLKWLDQ